MTTTAPVQTSNRAGSSPELGVEGIHNPSLARAKLSTDRHGHRPFRLPCISAFGFRWTVRPGDLVGRYRGAGQQERNDFNQQSESAQGRRQSSS
jgi:hypothetical protein